MHNCYFTYTFHYVILQMVKKITQKIIFMKEV